ncbi:hypothetical protein KKC08_01510 [Patescibacteria group bacterium]|nr:hypothetical protein [Patescibacteria group bacterium]MCG2702583.1 hypothetical protein [Candidatus Parcubacteria bacterium]MBU4210629.1 hypothetical protein [Patescibacteria group bacterium]MBU4264917.1 hypothetical protein [Patescibacteria group bacterium]MBU4390801.1 hypothetical protein [Patescibacteria group bacterium]
MAEIKEKGVGSEKVGIEAGGVEQPEKRIRQGLVETRKDVTLPREVKSWMEDFELDPSQQKSVSDDTGQKVLTAVDDEEVKVELPIDRKTFVTGFKKGLSEAGRWLSVFVFRIIKKNKGEVSFKKVEE